MAKATAEGLEGSGELRVKIFKEQEQLQEVHKVTQKGSAKSKIDTVILLLKMSLLQSST